MLFPPPFLGQNIFVSTLLLNILGLVVSVFFPDCERPSPILGKRTETYLCKIKSFTMWCVLNYTLMLLTSYARKKGKHSLYMYRGRIATTSVVLCTEPSNRRWAFNRQGIIGNGKFCHQSIISGQLYFDLSFGRMLAVFAKLRQSWNLSCQSSVILLLGTQHPQHYTKACKITSTFPD